MHTAVTIKHLRETHSVRLFQMLSRQLGLFVFSQKSEMTEKYFLRKILIQFNRVNLWLERLVGILVRLRY
mgnify:CR=1 FL=1